MPAGYPHSASFSYGVDMGDTAPGVIELERVAARGWQGTTSQRLGDWLLRAGHGFTGRANSVLPLGSPGCDLPDAMAVVADFYRGQDLPPMFQIPVCPETTGLDRDLDGLDWTSFNASWVLTARLDAAAAACPPRLGLPAARFEPRASPAWLDGYVYRGSPLPPAAVRVLENADGVVFASVSDAAGQAAVVRGVVTDGWLGVTALTVDARRRRGGFGRQLMGELLRWADAHGAERVYLQVAAENTAALALYDGLGFSKHHGYHYRRAPETG